MCIVHFIEIEIESERRNGRNLNYIMCIVHFIEIEIESLNKIYDIKMF